MSLFAKKAQHGLVKVRINRTASSPEGVWHKHSDYDLTDRFIGNIVEVEGISYKGFEVKNEKAVDMTAEIRTKDEVFEAVLEAFGDEDYLTARGLLFTFRLSAEPTLVALTVKGEESISWRMYVSEIMGIEAAVSEGSAIPVASQDELDRMLAESAEQSRRKRVAAISQLRATNPRNEIANKAVAEQPLLDMPITTK